jgi:hypothetical protein
MTVAAIARAEDPAISGAQTPVNVEIGELWDERSQSYPVKYITLEGIAINKVGDSPLQRDVIPSYRAILTNPSQVPSNLRSNVCSTTQLLEGCTGAVGEAMQASAMFPTQNTSRQQVFTPSSGAERVLTD